MQETDTRSAGLTPGSGCGEAGGRKTRTFSEKPMALRGPGPDLDTESILS